ncbi:MAG: tetratricopeptide repeat protein [Chloroflexi bacterium]|nr:tetratricopeptide repeat protein [Chloroflexota bacterium]
MFAFFESAGAGASYLLENPWFLVLAAFQIWMLVDAIRRQEWLWVIFIFLFPLLNALLYFFLVYRAASASATYGFELPGAFDRKRIKDLQAQIHHLDKAHHYSELGDIYFQHGKLAQAEECYQAALERDPADADTRAHFGQCLLRQNRAQDARPLLEQVCAENPKHDYGHTLMALAETLALSGERDQAIATWQQVLLANSYARAKVQLAELYLANGQTDLARAEIEEVLADDAHASGFQRKRDRIWIKRGKKLLAEIVKKGGG